MTTRYGGLVFQTVVSTGLIGQLVPIGLSFAVVGHAAVVARPVLNGIHHDYRRAA